MNLSTLIIYSSKNHKGIEIIRNDNVFGFRVFRVRIQLDQLPVQYFPTYAVLIAAYNVYVNVAIRNPNYANKLAYASIFGLDVRKLKKSLARNLIGIQKRTPEQLRVVVPTRRVNPYGSISDFDTVKINIVGSVYFGAGVRLGRRATHQFSIFQSCVKIVGKVVVIQTGDTLIKVVEITTVEWTFGGTIPHDAVAAAGE